MDKRKIVAGVVLGNSKRQKPEIRSALTWLDVKILEFKNRQITEHKYDGSDRMMQDVSELYGVLKFLYVSEIISTSEFNSIISYINGEEVEYDD